MCGHGSCNKLPFGLCACPRASKDITGRSISICRRRHSSKQLLAASVITLGCKQSRYKLLDPPHSPSATLTAHKQLQIFPLVFRQRTKDVPTGFVLLIASFALSALAAEPDMPLKNRKLLAGGQSGETKNPLTCCNPRLLQRKPAIAHKIKPKNTCYHAFTWCCL